MTVIPRGSAHSLKALMGTPEDPEVIYNGNIAHLPDWAESNLKTWMTNAGVGTVHITSTLRTPEDQARIMYNDIVNRGVDYERKLYGKGGNLVVDIYVMMSSQGTDAATIQNAMAAQIRSNPAKVSNHIATDDPDQAVADVAPSTVNGGDYQGFLDELKSARTRGYIKELIWPPKDAAIHIQFVKAGLDQAVAAAENVAQDAEAAATGEEEDGGSSVEGGDAEGSGLPFLALLGVAGVGGFLGVKAYKSWKRKGR